MNYIKRFRVEPGSKVDLAKIDAGFKDKHESHEQALPEEEQSCIADAEPLCSPVCSTGSLVPLR
jgi:hypothetical protein